MWESAYEYPLPDIRSGAVSGPHCIMPKGTSAAGNSPMLPGETPPVPVPANASTRLTGSETSDVDAVIGAAVRLATGLVPQAARTVAASTVTRTGASTVPNRLCGRLTFPNVSAGTRFSRGRRGRDSGCRVLLHDRGHVAPVLDTVTHYYVEAVPPLGEDVVAVEAGRPQTELPGSGRARGSAGSG